jgi:hypothetical protein
MRASGRRHVTTVPTSLPGAPGSRLSPPSTVRRHLLRFGRGAHRPFRPAPRGRSLEHVPIPLEAVLWGLLAIAVIAAVGWWGRTH